MARVKLSEFKAKSLLVDSYDGVSLKLATIDEDSIRVAKDVKYVVKVDQGIKKRGKQGLIRLNVSKAEVKQAVEELAEQGFSLFIAEPMLTHQDDEERYVSFERSRDGMVVTYSKRGGVSVEDNPDSVTRYTADTVPLPAPFVGRILSVMDDQHMSFCEINPLIVRGDDCILLDAAVLVDSAGEHTSDWTDDDIVDPHLPTGSEVAVAEMNQNSPAAFSFRVLNPDGAIWLLLSGGGASITIADEAMNQGNASLIGNYGEYSGGPTKEESYLYTKQVLSQMFQSKAPKKAVVIAGGVANFTDVKKTFKGVIQALDEVAEALRDNHVKVFVRRGGPNEKEGLAMMERFLRDTQLYGDVHGSDVLLTSVVTEALEFVDA